MTKKYPRIFVLNDPIGLRINPALAKEIGFNESLILLQIEFWISISNNKRDGKKWTYQSIRDIKSKSFPFWSNATINRTIKSLIKEEYIIEGNYNEKKYDKTRWFALNFEKLSKLESISIEGGYETRSNQNETGNNQDETQLAQSETTIPDITTDLSHKEQQQQLNKQPNNAKDVVGSINELKNIGISLKTAKELAELSYVDLNYVKKIIEYTNTLTNIKSTSGFVIAKVRENFYLPEEKNKVEGKKETERVLTHMLTGKEFITSQFYELNKMGQIDSGNYLCADSNILKLIESGLLTPKEP